jgi:CubicO group peptidase (beta-lactamase class C family)
MLTLLLALPLLAQIEPARIESLLLEAQKQQKIPGLALVLVDRQRILLEKAIGVASAESHGPLSPSHLMRLGSTTKMMVAATLVKLAAAGKIDLTSPIGKYFPQLPENLKPITPVQLLSHTSGLMDRTLMYGPHDDSALAANINELQPDVLFAKPGEVYSYSNLGYALAGRLIELVSGLSFADAVTAEVFSPLRMARSTFRPTLAMTWPFSQGHSLDAQGKPQVVRPVADHAGYWPAGSAFSSARELSLLASAILRQDRLTTVLSQPRATTPSGSRYGMGLETFSPNGHTLIGHSGSRRGYASYLLTLPERNLGLVLLANLEGASLAPLARLILASASGLNLSPPPAPHIPLDPARLTGLYRHYTLTLTVHSQNGQLHLSQSGRSLPLSPAPGPCLATPSTVLCFTLPPSGPAPFAHIGARAFAREP